MTSPTVWKAVLFTLLLFFVPGSLTQPMLKQSKSLGTSTDISYLQGIALDRKSSTVAITGTFIGAINNTWFSYDTNVKTAFLSLLHYNATSLESQWSTIHNANTDEWGDVIAFDSQSNVIIAGHSVLGSEIVFVSKYSNGQQLWDISIGSTTTFHKYVII